MKLVTKIELIMKTTLQNALKSNVNPVLFALSCAMLIYISFTAKALANDVAGATSGPAENMMMTTEGQVSWIAE
jgi:hypothetical protein